jgi:hypothetical protein
MNCKHVLSMQPSFIIFKWFRRQLCDGYLKPSIYNTNASSSSVTSTLVCCWPIASELPDGFGNQYLTNNVYDTDVSYRLDNFEQLNLGGYSSLTQDSAFQQLHLDTFQAVASVSNFLHGSAEM